MLQQVHVKRKRDRPFIYDQSVNHRWNSHRNWTARKRGIHWDWWLQSWDSFPIRCIYTHLPFLSIILANLAIEGKTPSKRIDPCHRSENILPLDNDLIHFNNNNAKSKPRNNYINTSLWFSLLHLARLQIPAFQIEVFQQYLVIQLYHPLHFVVLFYWRKSSRFSTIL